MADVALTRDTFVLRFSISSNTNSVDPTLTTATSILGDTHWYSLDLLTYTRPLLETKQKDEAHSIMPEAIQTQEKPTSTATEAEFQRLTERVVEFYEDYAPELRVNKPKARIDLEALLVDLVEMIENLEPYLDDTVLESLVEKTVKNMHEILDAEVVVELDRMQLNDSAEPQDSEMAS
ncbi:uncharacterized protein AB675_5602 [Cyphellophora attinorum]|uniref:Uncharacterized protein n=1 Tax=Cyphellophora attinorum TaxID=1664694 RepID=A0A0N1HWC4_9EURO|nr:uncharacterized protein AB675_5602 [Phialophora attinorum]KPI41887.1 hypothetical protein AB675_5602 [Phialophora attinorum]